MPVIARWGQFCILLSYSFLVLKLYSGFGFINRNHTPELVRNITRFIRDVTPGGAYIMAGKWVEKLGNSNSILTLCRYRYSLAEVRRGRGS